jgi:hypothetical protein
MILLFPVRFFSQTFSWQADTTEKNTTPAATSSLKTIYFNTYLMNVSNNPINLRVIRTDNQIPNGWSSSLCIGVCFPPEADSIDAPILNAGQDTLLELLVNVDDIPGTGTVTLKVKNILDPTDFEIKDFTLTTIPAAVKKADMSITGQYRLYSNYPNPFNSSTNISFEIGGQSAQRTIVIIYNVVGQRIRRIHDGILSPGLHEMNWDGRDALGRPVSSGIYFIELRTEQQFLMGKMFLLK